MKTTDLLQELIDCFTYSSGACWQMIHAHQDPRFIPLRDVLDQMKGSVMQIAMGPSDDVASRLKNRGFILPN